jgi:hypothetical protein
MYEEAARLAEREKLSYQRYLLDLVNRHTDHNAGRALGKRRTAARKESSDYCVSRASRPKQMRYLR